MKYAAFNEEELLIQINKLDNQRQLAFGLSCCERLLPNYVAFKNDTEWGDIAPLRNALDLIYAAVIGQLHSNQSVKDITIMCENVAPDSEDFTSLYVSFAQDACFAICGILDFLLNDDSRKIVQAATYAISSVDLFVQELENMDSVDPKLEEKILNHSLMQQELERQQVDLKNIAQVRVLDADFLEKLGISLNHNSKSNLT